MRDLRQGCDWALGRVAHVATLLIFDAVHLGNTPSSDYDRMIPLFLPPNGRLDITDREIYETANILGVRIRVDGVQIEGQAGRPALTQGSLPYWVKGLVRP